MDQRPKCNAGHYKTLRGKHRQNTLDINHSNMFFDPPPRVMKTKINQWDTIKLLEENIGRTLSDVNHSKIFFGPPQIGRASCRERV